MDAIKMFLSEVVACDVFNDMKGSFSYNGFKLKESSAAYQKKLHTLYEQALIEIPFLNQETKDNFGDIVEKYRETQSLFDVPDESILESMNREIEAGNTNESLRLERDFVKMVCECVSLQKYYLNEFAMAIGCAPKVQEQSQIMPLPIVSEDAKTSNDDVNQEWAYGYDGIMSAFKWGRNKVAGFLKDSYYAEAIVREGKKIAVNIPKARELMQKREQERKNAKRRRC